LSTIEEADTRLKMLLGHDSPVAFLGLWGIFDPPRSTVPPSIEQCHNAHIDVIMITGDQRSTAMAIGKLVGLVSSGEAEEAKGRPCSELKRSKDGSCSDAEHRLIASTKIWSRAQPSDKVAIVTSLRKDNITAMTGDGVNDAPALKGASIGVAMGIAGTAVTKNAADLILMDDNFSTIVAAVAEGRKIYGNVQKYVLFNLSMKGGELCCMTAAIFLGVPTPVAGLQQLVNMVITHIIPPMSLAWEDAEWYSMKVPPRDTKTDLVVNKTLMLFRWLPFVLCFALVVMTNMCCGLWMQTGFVTVNALLGSSKAGSIKAGESACEIAGHLDPSGNFVEDEAPFHCRCKYRSNVFDSKRNVQVWDQWGKPGADEVEVDAWTGSAGDAFKKENTPFAGADLVEECKDASGVKRNCWTGDVKPVLSRETNCAAVGAHIGQTMGYVGVQSGEVLSLLTFRSDSIFTQARFSSAYAVALMFNLTWLFLLLYVPLLNETLELMPLSPGRLRFALMTPVVLVLINELTKAIYRHQLAIQHALQGVFNRPKMAEP